MLRGFEGLSPPSRTFAVPSNVVHISVSRVRCCRRRARILCMRRRFFVDRFDSASASIRGDTAEHLGRVLRAEAGQLFELSDGHSVWLARIENVQSSKRGENRIDFSLVEPIPVRQSALSVQLFIALVKLDRFEWCIEKATELGASEIIPLAAARSDQALVATAPKRAARWKKIAVESAQQARRLRPPEILAARSCAEAFASCSAERKLLLSERREAPSIRESLGAGSGVISAALAIGPEGGWTSDEIRSAIAAGFAEVSLGENILRTETAVIASLAVLAFGLAP
jgi:16S rRNA (uracil1498-N3)-methyltransferase